VVIEFDVKRISDTRKNIIFLIYMILLSGLAYYAKSSFVN